jgi:propionyl-CoA carboxylase alpha chain
MSSMGANGWPAAVVPMRTLLVANRGEIARRIFSTARRMGIGTVAVFSDADHDAPHVADADRAVRLVGHAPTDTYLDIDAVIEAAVSTGADAIHPGYGFLSENAAFAEACAAAGIVFVGPSPASIAAMGSKIAAKQLMADAGVPTLPGVTIDDTVDTVDAIDFDAILEVTGLPALVKASFGGGGRGMRIVADRAELADAVASAQREAAAAFGDDTVFLERFVTTPRHIEVQIFGDQHGNVVHLFERECSIQRRYQKIIEEAPSPVVDDELRARLCEAATAAARALDYVGAGTVEFVLDAEGAFYFLEVNTRLQVEHPVTEQITGLDLVEAQLRVARGEPLPGELTTARIQGHAVEARLYAEDPSAGFRPMSGPIHRLRIPSRPGIRVDAGYDDGSTVSTHYDAMLAKVIATAPTRNEAVDALATALADAELHGPPTNRDLLVNVLRDDEFRAGDFDTGFLDRRDHTATPVGPADRRVHALAAALAHSTEHHNHSPTPAGIVPGWRNIPTAHQQVDYRTDAGEHIAVEYRHDRRHLDVRIDGEPAEVVVWSADPDRVDLTVDGSRRTVRVHRVGGTAYVDDHTGSTTLAVVPRFALPDRYVDPGSLVAPMPGTVVRVDGAVGDEVAAGATLVVIEAMKMEHRINAPSAGTIASILVAVGDQVDTGTLLATVEDPAVTDSTNAGTES